jgi:hypothetical protein
MKFFPRQERGPFTAVCLVICVVIIMPLIMILPVYGESSPITMGAYLDIGYLGSSTNPANRSWRTKSTSAFLDELELNNVTVFFNK